MPYTSTMGAGLKYSEQHFPTIIGNDGSAKTIGQSKLWIKENLESLKRELGCTGAVLFRGFPVSSAKDFDAFFSAFDYQNFTYKESLSNAVRVNQTEFVFTANEAPKEVEIYLHNEMAQTPVYPGIISLFCEETAYQGGETAICRSDFIYSQLLTVEPALTKKLEELGVKYTTAMPDQDVPESGQGRSWRGTLSVDTIAQAEEKLGSLNYSWQWNEDKSLAAQTTALPAIKTLENNRKTFFNQMIAAYLGWEGVKENPAKALCFGDDSAIPKSFLDAIVTIAQSLSYNIKWQNGDVAIVDNNLAMHGRLPYFGERKRKALVVLGACRT